MLLIYSIIVTAIMVFSNGKTLLKGVAKLFGLFIKGLVRLFIKVLGIQQGIVDLLFNELYPRKIVARLGCREVFVIKDDLGQLVIAGSVLTFLMGLFTVLYFLRVDPAILLIHGIIGVFPAIYSLLCLHSIATDYNKLVLRR